MILGYITEATKAGARERKACEIAGISARTLQRWRKQDIGEDRRSGPRSKPKNKLTRAEELRILEILTSPEFRDLSPQQIVPKLADRGIHLASVSTFYRLLGRAEMQRHREPTQAPRPRPKGLVATGPNQVWSWDITYLHSPVRGSFFYLYMVMDVWSRKIVAWEIHESESGADAARMIEAACRSEGVKGNELTLHSDNGSPMRSATLAAKLASLNVQPSFSRPSVSNDNAYSESLFRTLKVRPKYPYGFFDSVESARHWVEEFTHWYNEVHLHSRIRFVTPGARHRGEDVEILEQRKKVYAAARKKNPERWSGKTRNWERIETVELNPENRKNIKQEAA